MAKKIAYSEREGVFLNGCGVDYVHWIPAFEKLNINAFEKQCDSVPNACRFGTPMLAMVAEHEKVKSQYSGNAHGAGIKVRMVRIRKALARNQIGSWLSLASMSSPQFRNWKNYGEISHKELVRVAAENGYKIAGWK